MEEPRYEASGTNTAECKDKDTRRDDGRLSPDPAVEWITQGVMEIPPFRNDGRTANKSIGGAEEAPTPGSDPLQVVRDYCELKRLMRHLAQGAMYEGVVKDGDGSTRRVCVKVVTGTSPILMQRRRMLKQEFDGLAMCDHPGIHKVYKFLESDECSALVTQMMTCDLFFIGDRVPDAPRTTGWVMALSKRLVAAVHYLHHTLGVCHLDIKPENIFVKFPKTKHPAGRHWTYSDFFDEALLDQFEIVLSDFQFWTPCRGENNESKFIHGVVGSTGYMAPEVAMQRPFDGMNADIWSLGRTLFVVAIGFPPWEAAVDSDAFYSAWRMGQTSEFWEAMGYHCKVWTVDNLWEDLITKMMSINRRRPSTTEIIRHPFFSPR